MSKRGFREPPPSTPAGTYVVSPMNRELLEIRLAKRFDADAAERRVVTRQAVDLHDSGRYAESRGVQLTIEAVLTNLADAPDGYGLVDRWNWWIGALDLAHGDFGEFMIHQWAAE